MYTVLKHRSYKKDAVFRQHKQTTPELQQQQLGLLNHSSSSCRRRNRSNLSFFATVISRNMQHVVARAVHALAQALFLSSCLLFTFWLLYAGVEYWRDNNYWGKHINGIKPIFGCQHDLLANSCQAQQLLYDNILYMLLVPAIISLSAIVNLSFRKPNPQSGVSRISKGRQFLQVMLPPRRFLLHWCSGLSLSDLLLIAFWLTVNFSWFSVITSRNIHKKIAKLHLLPADLTSTNHITTSSSTDYDKAVPSSLIQTMQLVHSAFRHQQQQQGSSDQQLIIIKTVYKCVARSLGALLYPNLAVLFYPVARGSVVLQAMNIPYPAAIRYHRWFGHFGLFLASLHSVLYWAIWIYEGRWFKTAFKQDADYNYLFGGLAFLFGLALWVTSLETIRRRNFGIFKIMHHIGFWGWMLFAICHNWYLFWFGLPGLVLYGIDAVYRIHQSAAAVPGSSSSSSRILKAAVSPDLSVCSLLIHYPGFRSSSSGFVWLSVPELGYWGTWHPFEYVTVPVIISSSSGGSSSTALLVHIKAYSRWTKKLIQLVAKKGEDIEIKIQGPYAKRSGLLPAAAASSAAAAAVLSNQKTAATCHDHDQVDGVIFVAGGMGASAVLSVLADLEAAAATTAAAAASGGSTAAGSSSSSSLPALLIWCCRCPSEFEFLGPRVLLAAQQSGLIMTVKLFLTGPVSRPEPLLPPQQQQDADNTKSCLIMQQSRQQQQDEESVSLTCPASSTTSCRTSSHNSCSNSSSSSSSIAPICPVLALGSVNRELCHKVVMHAAEYSGVLLAILLARYISLIKPNEPWPTAQMGALYVACIAAAVVVSGSSVLLLTPLLLGKRQQQQLGATAAAGSVNGIKGVHYERLPSADGGSARAVHCNAQCTAALHQQQQQHCGVAAALAAGAVSGVMGTLTPASSTETEHNATTVKAPELLQLQIPTLQSLNAVDDVHSLGNAADLSNADGLLTSDMTSNSYLSVKDDTAVGVPTRQWLPVECGRPPLQQLISNWITVQQQQQQGSAGHALSAIDALSAGDALSDNAHPATAAVSDWDAKQAGHERHSWGYIDIEQQQQQQQQQQQHKCGQQQQQQQQYNVYCMGPTPLVESVMLLCDDHNKASMNVRGSSSSSSSGDKCMSAGSSSVYLNCIRETWEL